MTDKIYAFLYKALLSLRFSKNIAAYTAEIIYAAAFVILSLAIYFVLKLIYVALLNKTLKKFKKGWKKELLKSKAFLKLFKLIPGFIFLRLLNAMPRFQSFFEILTVIYIALMSVSFASALFNSVNVIYTQFYSQSKSKPIKGIISVIKILLFTVALIIILSRISGQSPVYVLSGLGALSAISLLIFKDSILGFVAGFQMTANDLVRLGDWIEVPKYGADGDVIDISLSFVKVQNWDKTIVSIPAYALVSDSFKNWRGMFDLKGRRIKRSINIDAGSVSFCSNSLIEKLSEIDLLKNYLNERAKEIDEYNKKNKVNTNLPVNGRHLTNLGTFRRYITEYLKRHKGVHKNMTIMVRQLQTESKGIPLEIYAFANDTVWVNYESIMADIFDHIYASAGFFELKIYQDPSGGDFKKLVQ